MKTLDELRYPVGRFEFAGEVSERERQAWIEEIAQAPAQLREATKTLTEEHLETPYRPGGWTVRQVVHHLADSHMNAYIRFRLALTEDSPLIKPYDEKGWADLVDARTGRIEVSLVLFEALHERLVQLLRTLTPADWERTFQHPDRGVSTLARTLGMYAWHGRHHIAQIASVR